MATPGPVDSSDPMTLERAEELVNANEPRIRLTVNNLPSVVAQLHILGKLNEIIPGCENLIRATKDELIRQIEEVLKPRGLSHPHDPRPFAAQVAECGIVLSTVLRFLDSEDPQIRSGGVWAMDSVHGGSFGWELLDAIEYLAWDLAVNRLA